MLKKLFKKEKFPTKLFIAVSIVNFIILLIFVLILVSYIGTGGQKQSELVKNDDRLFLKSDFDFGDEYITNVPQLEDMLEGPIISKRDPIIGEFESPVAIVIFSDFECQFCQNQEKIIKEIIREYPSQTQLIWKDYPVQDKNSYSWRAAKAARCAQGQEKFWEYHDLLFDSANNQFDEKFLLLAGELDLEINKFKECLQNQEAENLIMDNILEAQALDIVGIPFIYVNDQEIMGNIDYEDLKKIINSEIEKNT